MKQSKITDLLIYKHRNFVLFKAKNRYPRNPCRFLSIICQPVCSWYSGAMRPSKRDELVRKALQIFYRNGFHATGMDTLALEAGISKTAMYNHFRTKEDLILAALRLRDERFRHRLFKRMEERATSPRDQLLAVFDVLDEWFHEPDFSGCMFVKASSEYQDPDHPIHLHSAEHKRIIERHFKTLAQSAGLANPARIARQLLLLKEGATVAAQLGYSEHPARDAKRVARLLLKVSP